mmetsp:Transcript_20898/g.37731  ORF Transcript_20898/g.37731 Transcript_20898/m.37731 type:complete len:80 (-) Transcript_20898:777-1016(-)
MEPKLPSNQRNTKCIDNSTHPIVVPKIFFWTPHTDHPTGPSPKSCSKWLYILPHNKFDHSLKGQLSSGTVFGNVGLLFP